MRNRRTIRVIIASTAMGVVVGGVGTEAAFAGDPGSGRAAIASERKADASSTLAAGRVLDATGHPAADVTVTAYAYPSDSVMSTLVEGDAVPVVDLSSAVKTAKNGTYTLKANYDKLLTSAGFSPSEPVNVQVVATSEQGVATYSFVVDLDARTGRATATAEGTADTATVGARASGLGLDLKLTAEAPAVDTEATSTGDVSTMAYTPPITCSIYTNYGPQWVIVGATNATTSGHTQKLTYGVSASSTLGIGVSASGAYGSFSASGTQSRSSSGEVGFPTYSTAGSRYMKTQYTYGKLRCVQPTNGVVYWNVVPMDFVAGSSVTAATTPTANLCTSFSAGSSYSKSTSTAITWSNGAQLAGVVGIDLSARTGYTTSAKMDYTFSTTRQLCGSSDYPGGTPYQLVVK